MNDKVYNWFLASSADPTKLSLTIKGAIVFIPTFIMLMQVFGLHSFTEASLTELINNVAAFVSGAFVLYGLGRKIYYQVKIMV